MYIGSALHRLTDAGSLLLVLRLLLLNLSLPRELPFGVNRTVRICEHISFKLKGKGKPLRRTASRFTIYNFHTATMSYMREKVAPVRISPPPGSYKGPIRITMETPTPNAEILFTLDESLPVHNSDREHGYRCEHYKDYLGFELKENGEHILTIQAHKKGLVSAPVQKLKYTITHSHTTAHTSLPDMMIERRFYAMEQLDPPMQVRQARKRNANMQCALVDTCPRSVLREKVQNGEPLALFKLKYDAESAAGRNYQYARVVSPNMKMTMPQLPSSKSRAKCSPAVELLADGIRSTTPMLYKPPRAYENLYVGDASLPPLNASAISGGVIGRRAHSQMSQQTRVQLAIFEHKAGTDQYVNAQDYYDDKDDLNEMMSYQSRNTDLFIAETSRIIDTISPNPRISVEKLKDSMERMVGRSDDVSGADAKTMSLLVQADSACVDSGLRRFLSLVPYTAIHAKIGSSRVGDRITIFDLLSLCDNAVDQRQLTDMLKLYEANPNHHPASYAAQRFLQFCRFVITVHRGVPEAVFGLLGMGWRDEQTLTSFEPMVGRVVLQGLLDHYRRAEGYNRSIYEVGVRLLNLGKSEGGLEWTEESSKLKAKINGRTSATQFLSRMCELCPSLDKSLQNMDDITSVAYQSPLPKPTM